MFSSKLLLVIFACFSLSAECFTHLPQTRVLRQTHLNSQLHEAAAKGDIEYCLDQLATDSNLISKFDIDGQLMLHHACKAGHIDLVKILVEKGPGYVNFKNVRWRTPLHWACSYAGYEGFEACEEISYFLVRNGANFNQDNKDGFCPMDYAKKGPLGKTFADKLRKEGQGVIITKVALGLGPSDRVYWG